MLIVSLAFGAITGFMLNPTILQTMTTGSFITFLVASGMLIKPIRQLTEIIARFKKALLQRLLFLRLLIPALSPIMAL